MVLQQEGIENPPRSTDYIFPFFWNQETDEDVLSMNTSAIMVVPSQTGGQLEMTSASPTKWAPLVTKFAYLTGLSPETKLTINCRIFYETFPSILEEDILTLATPSPDIDPHALAFYQHCVTHLPVGVPVSMNGLGDWFAEAVSEFSDVLELGLSATGIPFASQIAKGSKALADRYIKTRAATQKAQGKTASTAMSLAERKKKERAKRRKAAGVTAPAIPPGKPRLQVKN